MLVNQISKRYAKSLLELAIEKKVDAKVLQDIYILQDMLKGCPSFRTLMRSPIVPSHKKNAIWKLLSKDMNSITQLFISLLIQKGREQHVEAIIEAFIEQNKAMNGVVDMIIYSPIILDKKIVDHIGKIVKKEINAKSIEVQNKIDTSLIGGFVLQVKDKVVDLSIAKKLKDIEKQILA